MTTAPLHTRAASDLLNDACKALSAKTGLTIVSGYIGGNLERLSADHRIWYVWVQEATVPHWGGGRNRLSLGASDTAEGCLEFCTLEHLDRALRKDGVLPAEIKNWRLETVKTSKQSAADIAAYKIARTLGGI